MLNKHILIENIIFQKSKITFILESPHKEEICEGYPLAGQTGKELTKYLIEDSHIPFGKEVKEGSLMNKVSIINVSKYPLQGSAYCCEKNKPSNIYLYEKLKILIDRGASYSTKHIDREINNLKEEIYTSFLNELKKLPNESFIVPCGRFARKFSNYAKLEDSLKNKNFVFINSNIPHPSRGKWSSISKEIIEKIKSKIL